MKPFSLDKYHKNPSQKLITRDGRTVRRILCTDARGNYPVIALVDCGDYDSAFSYTKEGKFYNRDTDTSENDLFFATEKYELWLNVYKGECGSHWVDPFGSKEDALMVAEDNCDYVTTVKIEWEE